MQINLENESGKHYIHLDRHEYTSYPEEEEVLLQAGISAKVEFVYNEKINGEIFTVFVVYIQEKQVNYMQRVKALEFSLPFTMYFIGYLVQAEIVMRLN